MDTKTYLNCAYTKPVSFFVNKWNTKTVVKCSICRDKIAVICYGHVRVRLVDRRRTAGGASQGGCRRREVWTEYLDTRQRVDLVGKLILKEFRKNWGIALS